MDIIEYIKMQRANGLDDYMALQSAKKYTMNQHKLNVSLQEEGQVGGATGTTGTTGTNIERTTAQLDVQIAKELEEEKKQSATSSTPHVNELISNRYKMPIKSEIIYETIQKEWVLYHPSQELKRFSDTSIFVNIAEQCKQKSFALFFTPNEKYAKRYSGLWSLNKRPVYVHKLVAKSDIPRIKVIKADDIPDSIENIKFAQDICGMSIDGHINGIKIEQYIDGENISEYYICNPETFLKSVATSMQFSSGQWIDVRI